MELRKLASRWTPDLVKQAAVLRWLHKRPAHPEPMVGPVPRPSFLPPGNLREQLAREFIRGTGLEIGALHNPLFLPRGVTVRYVDRWRTSDPAELAQHYPELAGTPVAPVDVIDDGTLLVSIPCSSQDFLIANHFLEHVQDPLGTLRRHLEVLKPGGILYLAVPDKRFTFDRKRPVTPLEHLFRDFKEGPEWSFRDHIREWVELVENQPGAALEGRVATLCGQENPPIHYHVWTQEGLLELLLACQQRLGLSFEIQGFLLNRPLAETICVLRKGPAEQAG